jgi:hypothetical protein
VFVNNLAHENGTCLHHSCTGAAAAAKQQQQQQQQQQLVYFNSSLFLEFSELIAFFTTFLLLELLHRCG